MREQRQFGRLAQVLAIILLVVLAVSGTAQAAHSHAAEAGHDSHCQLCLMAHHSVVPELQTAPVDAQATVAAVHVRDAQPVMSRALLTTRIRPPPVSL